MIRIDNHEPKNEFPFKDFFREREQIRKNPSFFMQLPYEDSSFRSQLLIKYKAFSSKFFHVTLQYHKKWYESMFSPLNILTQPINIFLILIPYSAQGKHIWIDN